MNKLTRAVTGFALLLPVAGVIDAAPVFKSGANEVFFQNVENLYRTTGACTPATCLPFDLANDPAGYQRVNPGVANNIELKDIFAGIFNVQNIENAGQTIWFQNPNTGDTFGGYFAQEVAEIINNGPGVRDFIGLTTASVDPFGVLNLPAGEAFRFYTGMTYGTGGPTFADVAAATAGPFWASMGTGVYGPLFANGPGVGSDPDGYGYTETELALPINPSSPEFFSAMNIVEEGPSYNAGILNKINDINENAQGGVAGPNGICTPAEILAAVITCTDLVGTSEIEANPGFGLGPNDSPWAIRSNDPFQLNQVPEPAVLVLFGIGLAGLGAARCRKRV